MKVSLDGHRERMRERLENIGATDVRSQELMEFLLYQAVPQKDTKQLAADLLEQLGSVEGVLRSDEQALRKVPGINGRIVKWLRLVGNITGIYSAGRGIDRHRMNNLRRTQAYFTRFFQGCTYHEMWQCCLTAGGRFISAAKIAANASWGEGEYLRDALDDAITARAVGVVLGRYSPQPGAQFGEYDIERTRAYAVTLAAANVQLMDHVLICPDGVRSLYHEGGLDRIKSVPGAGALRENYLNEDIYPEDDCPEDDIWELFERAENILPTETKETD